MTEPPAPTTPIEPVFHGALPQRGLDGTPSSTSHEGRFGRMFRNLPVTAPADDSLVKLSEAMVQPLEDGVLDKPLGEPDDDENTAQLDGELRLPAGYTYFGQFVDHDITFDPVSSLSRQNDPDGLTDFRTPRLDLDNVYGRGPADQPYLYDADHLHLSLGRKLSPDQGTTDPTAGPDLLRVEATGRAIIGDPRNDENKIVSQLQATMIRFHNTVLDRVGNENRHLTQDDVFKLAQKTVRWHYQWIVIHDYLRRLVGDEVIDDILSPQPYAVPGGQVELSRPPRLRFFRWEESPYMPVEFSVAAYRFGHSMVRPSYLINTVAAAAPPVEGASRIPIFTLDETPTASLDGFQALPDNWAVQWRFFLSGIEDGLEADPRLPQPSYKLDAQLSHPLGALPDSTAGSELLVAGVDPSIAKSLAFRNLLRGKRLGLPAGQAVARAMGIEPLSEEELYDGVSIEAGVREDLEGRAPLWFYVLKEAEKRAESAHLGPVAGRIIAEVLIGLLAGDPLSYLSVEPNWKPELPARQAGTFTLADLVNLAIPAPEAPVPDPYP